MTIPVTLMGLGAIGVGYDLDKPFGAVAMTHARAFARHPAFRLAGGVDADARARRRFQDAYGAPTFVTVAEALAGSDPGVVVLATPTSWHRAHLEEVLAVARPRLILCEKPLAPSAAEADQMVVACRSAGVPLFVNYMRRMDPAVRWLAGAVRDGRVALPARGVCWYSKGLLHNGSHLVDLLAHVLGPPVAKACLATGRHEPYGPEPEVRIAFPDAEVTFLPACEESFSYGGIELVTRNGVWRYDHWGERAAWRPAHPDGSGLLPASDEMQWLTGLDGIQYEVASAIADAVAGDPVPLCTGVEAASWVRWLTMGYRPEVEGVRG